jgi:hypothetical protein
MATYREIQNEVKAACGFVPKTCWIAHVLELLGLKLRTACNRISPKQRKHPCPPEKVPAIVAAVHKLGKLRATETSA